MIVQLAPNAELSQVRAALQGLGLGTDVSQGLPGTPPLLSIQAGSSHVDPDELRSIPGIASVWCAKSPHPLLNAQGPVVRIGDLSIGGPTPILMAGPCAVESEEQIFESAKMVSAAGATFLRGGAFKPRTSPYSFQGHGTPALGWMRSAADAYGLHVVTEAMAPEQVDVVAEHADLFQIGARNMQNYDLLRAVGSTGKPALLKRGISATLQEWRLAAEHLLYAGCKGVIFCERGVRHFDSETRFILDLAAVALLRDVYNAPVIVDPSHATGRRDIIPRMGIAALASGACGLIVETHPNPPRAMSDGPQQLTCGELLALSSGMGLTRERCRASSEPKPAISRETHAVA